MKHVLLRFFGCIFLFSGLLALTSYHSFAAIELSPNQKITPNTGIAGDSYGWSVALDGDTLMVGSVYDGTAADDAGAVYVYTWNGTKWGFLQKLLASDAAVDDELGVAIALEGDTAMISAVYDADKGYRSGAVYIFERDAITGLWGEVQKLVPDDGASQDLFGISIALEGDLALIGAPGDATPIPVKDGSFYAYERIGDIWTQQDRIIAPILSKIGLGASLTLDGTTAYVSAVLDGSGLNRHGAVYVYEYAGGELTEVDKIEPSDGTLGDLFGVAIRVLGDRLLISAPGDDTSGPDTGSIYTFHFENDEWVESGLISAPEGDKYLSFGASLAVENDTLLVGVPNEIPPPDGQTFTSTKPGAAYVYVRSGDEWTLQYSLTANNLNADYFGIATAFQDNHAVVGAFGDNKGKNETGAVHTFALTSNIAPVNTVPAAGAMTLKNTATKFFQTEPDHGVSVADADISNNPLLINLEATNGTLTLSAVNGLTFIDGDGTDDAVMTFSGRKARVNTALDGLMFTPDSDFVGDADITLTSNDQGYSGTGGALEDSDTFTVTVENAVELVKNGGFETAKPNDSQLPAQWTSNQLDNNDRLRCNTNNTVYAYRESCAFQFTGAAGRSPLLNQTINGSFAAGDTLVLSASIDRKQAAAGRVIRARINYFDNSTENMDIQLQGGTSGGYESYAETLVLPQAVQSIKLQILYNKPSGKFTIDEVSILHTVALAPLTSSGADLRGN